jgi:hypothetical protein
MSYSEGTMKTGADIVAAGATCPTGPTKYTAQTLDTLLEAIADGLTISQACKAARISRQCHDNWRDRFPEFAEALEQAREDSRRKALAIIKQAALNGDYNAAVQFLRFSFHPDYSKPGTNVQVTATALVCDEPTRERLIQLNRKLLSGSSETKQLLAPAHQN